jgi:hypothetical protein
MKALAILVGVILVIAAIVFFTVTSSPNGFEGQHAVSNGFESDWISASEKLANNAAILWMRYDNRSAYCTFDNVDDLLLRAEFYALHDIRVVFNYTSVNLGTTEYSIIGLGGCGSNVTEINTIYRLTDLRAANPDEEPSAEQLAQLATNNQ